MAHTQVPAQQTTAWSLEVVRGRDVGRVFGLSAGELVLGSGLGGGTGLDLREQEGESPRRMAARQAALELKGPELTIRDLDSPGGTFVNRQRLLAGQARRLQPGDVIQLGAVQLRVGSPAAVSSNPSPARNSDRVDGVNSRATPPPLPSRNPAAPAPMQGASATVSSGAGAGRLPIAFAMAGASCRSWDDFLVVAAQRWKELSAELASGRLADYLRRINRPDLVPQPSPGLSADERLDRWLARIPTTQPSAPELDVHPDRLDVRAVGGGGVTRQVLRITNVGYRLLRCTARVEPAETSWIRLRPEHDGRSFDTIEETELPVEVTIPDVVGRALSASILLESNGGTRRVVVQLERPVNPAASLDSAPEPVDLRLSEWLGPLVRRISRLPAIGRILAGIAGALSLRVLVAVSGLIPIGGPGAEILDPRLPALAVLCAAVGLTGGAMLGRRRDDVGPFDRLAAGVAAGLFGIIAAAILYAIVRTIERPLGAWSTSAWAVGLLWSVVGAAIAGISCSILPSRVDSTEAPR